MALLSGRIMQSISGFYYVEAADRLFECKAKGSFRNKRISPLVGDIVKIETDGDKGTVIEINERKNSLIRPPVANIDVLFIVASVSDPKPNLFVIDKLSAFAVHNNIKPVILFSKCDLGIDDNLVDVYRKSPFQVICCSSYNNYGADEIFDIISGKVCAFTGNSGVGKSSILNMLDPQLTLETNAISNKLGRGKHTTRSVSLYCIRDGFIADTPGFSYIDFEKITEKIYKDDLPDCFPEFADFVDNCRFGVSCAHINDKGCAVIEAVKNNLISEQRHESYKKMYEEVKNFKKWQ